MRVQRGKQGWRVAVGAACILSVAAAAQPSRTPATTSPGPAAPVAAVPQQTTATFADWTLRCSHVAAGQVCEIVQGVSSQDRTVAQLAIGRVAKGQPLHLTILVPPSVSFAAEPALASTHEGDPALLAMAWRRCLPGGCMADGTLTDELLRRVRGSAEPMRVTFADAGGRTVALPLSPQGLPQALDALAKDDGG